MSCAVFLWLLSTILFMSSLQCFDYNEPRCDILCLYLTFYTLGFLNLYIFMSFTKFRKISAIISLNIFSDPLFLSYSSETSIIFI